MHIIWQRKSKDGLAGHIGSLDSGLSATIFTDSEGQWSVHFSTLARNYGAENRVLNNAFFSLYSAAVDTRLELIKALQNQRGQAHIEELNEWLTVMGLPLDY